MTDLKKELLWRERVEHLRESGLSQSAFALANGFPAHQISYWVRRFTAASPAQSLLPVTISAAPACAPAVTLHSPSGWTVSVPAGLAPAALAELLRCLS